MNKTCWQVWSCCHLAVRELSVMYRGGPGGGGRSLVFAGRRRRVGALASFMYRASLTVSLVRGARSRWRIFPWAGVRGTVGGGRAGGLAGTIGRMGPWVRRSAGAVTLITNKTQTLTKQNKTKR